MAYAKIKLKDRLYNVVYSRSKNYEYITQKDLISLYNISSKIYYNMCLDENLPHVIQPKLFETADAHRRSWEINGPSNVYNEDEIYMYCISYKKLHFHPDVANNFPSWYSPCTSDENLQPSGTCFKIKVDEII